MSSTLPNFLMLGAPRTGSTALHNALHQHPDFFLPRGKETHFFSGGGDISLPALYAVGFTYRVVQDARVYAEGFVDGAAFSHRGEIDPSILYRAAYALPKMRALLAADTKFIVVLRQPVERAYSHYLLHVRYGHEPHPFEYYFDVTAPRTPFEEIALDRYFGFSIYSESLKLFFNAFPRENFLVLLYDDLQKDSRAFLLRILEFLNAELTMIPSFVAETNAGLAPQNLMGRMRAVNHPLRRFLRACVPLELRAAVRQQMGWEKRGTRDFYKPALAAATRVKLLPRYREDILRTQDLIQRDLTHWL